MKIEPVVIRNEYITHIRLEKNYSSYTVSEYETDIDTFLQFMEREGLDNLNDITYTEARLFITTLYERDFSRATISRKISAIRSFFTFANARYHISDVAFQSLHHPKKQDKLPAFFYEEELELLFAAAEGTDKKSIRDYALLEILYSTGIRVGELTAIELQHIDFSLEIIMVMGKGRKERYIPFGSFAHRALRQYIEQSRPKLMKNEKHPILFVNMRGGPLTNQGVRHILDQLMEKAALHTKIYPHMIRHTFATHLLSNGADMRSVQELLGHTHLSSTQVYTHVTKEHLRKTYMNTHPRA